VGSSTCPDRMSSLIVSEQSVRKPFTTIHEAGTRFSSTSIAKSQRSCVDGWIITQLRNQHLFSRFGFSLTRFHVFLLLIILRLLPFRFSHPSSPSLECMARLPPIAPIPFSDFCI
jgi:hypothetical protein